MNKLLRFIRNPLRRKLIGIEAEIGANRTVLSLPQLRDLLLLRVHEGQTVKVDIARSILPASKFAHLESENEGLKSLNDLQSNDFSKIEPENFIVSQKC